MLYTFLKLYTWVTINIMDSSESDTFVSITTSDVFWDGSVVNPTEVLPATAGVSGPRPLTSVLGTGSSVPVSGATTSFQGLGPEGLAVGMVTSCAVATSTCSRPVYSSGSLNPTPGQAMGVTFSGNSGTPVVSFANTGFSGFSGFLDIWVLVFWFNLRMLIEFYFFKNSKPINQQTSPQQTSIQKIND